ncbi:uncharacterized protein NDAI_0G00240 [Naumovozyma dairenensis CBS 421]|uniref:Cullin family profile domain-containing protein n=1 Tax=Naumovozyma dairenensis (strain ATCC 10597 / BCRC 20456 / CBS 421 / NBRC 0211 / NRRL Y-12639) TaxID=1071378 RepID=G0WDD9_NAUDC|nr:hypothetical protein NDAI_0G00240 [Naumovozyma dairenensis CBS 421]CCD25800.2 hypothetical protein NDAI_0G00240 [Naumovozyma dairenensis CBS 421]
MRRYGDIPLPVVFDKTLTAFKNCPTRDLAAEIYQYAVYICEMSDAIDGDIPSKDWIKQKLKGYLDETIEECKYMRNKCRPFDQWQKVFDIKRKFDMRLALLTGTIGYIEDGDEYISSKERGLDMVSSYKYTIIEMINHEVKSLRDFFQDAYRNYVIHDVKNAYNDAVEIYNTIETFERIRSNRREEPYYDLSEYEGGFGLSIVTNGISGSLTKPLPIGEILQIFERAVRLELQFSLKGSALVKHQALTRFIKNSELLLKSLSGVQLTADTICSLIEASYNAESPDSFKEAFINERKSSFVDDFNDIIIKNINLTEPNQTKKSHRFPFSEGTQQYKDRLLLNLRTAFKDSVSDIPSFNKKLIKYCNLKIKSNYDEIRIYAEKEGVLSNSDRKWVNWMRLFFQYYVPTNTNFINQYYLPSTLKRILMLNMEYTTFFKNKRSIEAALNKEFTKYLPIEYTPVNELIQQALHMKPELINNDETSLFLLHLKSEGFGYGLPDHSKDTVQPLWLHKSFTDTWQQKRDEYKKQGKTLHNSFGMHVMEMSSNITLTDNRCLTLVVNPNIAAILYQFNDADTIPVSVLKEKLMVERNQELQFNASLKKLLRHGILLLNNKQLTFNDDFKPNPHENETGVLKLM